LNLKTFKTSNYHLFFEEIKGVLNKTLENCIILADNHLRDIVKKSLGVEYSVSKDNKTIQMNTADNDKASEIIKLKTEENVRLKRDMNEFQEMALASTIEYEKQIAYLLDKVKKAEMLLKSPKIQGSSDIKEPVQHNFSGSLMTCNKCDVCNEFSWVVKCNSCWKYFCKDGRHSNVSCGSV